MFGIKLITYIIYFDFNVMPRLDIYQELSLLTSVILLTAIHSDISGRILDTVVRGKFDQAGGVNLMKTKQIFLQRL